MGRDIAPDLPARAEDPQLAKEPPRLGARGDPHPVDTPAAQLLVVLDRDLGGQTGHPPQEDHDLARDIGMLGLDRDRDPALPKEVEAPAGAQNPPQLRPGATLVTGRTRASSARAAMENSCMRSPPLYVPHRPACSCRSREVFPRF